MNTDLDAELDAAVKLLTDLDRAGELPADEAHAIRLVLDAAKGREHAIVEAFHVGYRAGVCDVRERGEGRGRP